MKKPMILVVDDDDDVRRMLCVLLSAEGYMTAGAANGMEALERIHRERPAFILTDLMMPRMIGEDLIQAMAQDPLLSRIPVAIMSGHSASATCLLAPSVIARLTKPIEFDELLTLVRQFTAGRHSHS